MSGHTNFLRGLPGFISFRRGSLPRAVFVLRTSPRQAGSPGCAHGLPSRKKNPVGVRPDFSKAGGLYRTLS